MHIAQNAFFHGAGFEREGFFWNCQVLQVALQGDLYLTRACRTEGACYKYVTSHTQIGVYL
jgi:hypothetical protein